MLPQRKRILLPPNHAYAGEWLSCHQYWLGAKVIQGPMKDEAAAELTPHATLPAARIIPLHWNPVLEPRQWYVLSPCRYDVPADPCVAVLLAQNIEGQQCAISAYRQLMDVAKDKDMVTYNLALTILDQEVEDEEDLQSLKEDLELMVHRGGR